jgi:hypothetical protein
MSTSFRYNINGMILYQSIRGVQYLNAKRLLIKSNIASDNDLSFDRIKQLIRIRLFIVSHHDAGMDICIQILSTIIKNVSPINTSKQTKVVDRRIPPTPLFDWSHGRNNLSRDAIEKIIFPVHGFSPKERRQIFSYKIHLAISTNILFFCSTTPFY